MWRGSAEANDCKLCVRFSLHSSVRVAVRAPLSAARRAAPPRVFTMRALLAAAALLHLAAGASVARGERRGGGEARERGRGQCFRLLPRRRLRQPTLSSPAARRQQPRCSRSAGEALTHHTTHTAPPTTTTAPARLDLCDCEWASGGPGNLSCPREGFIVTGYERVGRWAAGGGDVPLSRARCCRPCLPDDEDDGDDTTTTSRPRHPLAVLSLDCRSPTAGGDASSALLCDADTGGFVVGFADARRVGGASPRSGAFYPAGPPRCCTPALLAPNGDVAELRRCDCVTVPGVSCEGGGGNTTTPTRALRGFRSWRVAPSGDVLPAGPVECCTPCALAPSDDPARDCGGGCSGRGACVLGECVCRPGWRGASCSVRTGNALADALQALAGAVSVGVVLGGGVLVARAAARRGGDDDDDDDGPRAAARRLLTAADGGAGSVGSADTDDEVEGGDVEEGGGAAKTPSASPPPPPADDEKAAAAAAPPPAPADAGAAAVAGATCVVCTDRSVQVVLIPCGHACTCRRCARRLVRCPVCRADAARRQRLWVGG